MMFYKLKAGALQFTMFIVVVIALLLAAFIILIHTHKQFSIQNDFVLETINNSKKGIAYALENTIRTNDTISIRLQDQDYKTLLVHRDYWGLYEKMVSISKIKTNTFKRIALVGASQPKTDRVALYVEEQNKPLVVVGNTKIQGVAYLPKQGVRTGNIAGHAYYGDQLIYGKTKTSHSLPELLSKTYKQLKDVNNTIKDISGDHFLDVTSNRTHKNSFYNPIQIVYSNTDINLSGITLMGHIIVQSKTKITVDASSNLKDVILIAPVIDIKNHVMGTFQTIASKKINVGKNCKLNYPSALILNQTTVSISSNVISNQKNEFQGIMIDKGTEIRGTVVYSETEKQKNFKAQVIIEEGATITGEVYCNRNLELKGRVYGSVFTSNFVANQSGSIYQNHIYNGRILINELPEEYVGLPFKNSKKDVIKWLY
ncbi:hypothetical protein [Flavivirga jejuensis]|uniref:Cytoskeletal protein CcmA (Bactofilin family) n=1 Tax=Flavivirga jejuensis TaxID=870487 RepID=A0ABT8WMY9_9FLAO|nr:hypothetical protein [Flavivirga jejuensis]MDO5974523.1 hypothetical protein [Flavivirga jejuensis]